MKAPPNSAMARTVVPGRLRKHSLNWVVLPRDQGDNNEES